MRIQLSDTPGFGEYNPVVEALARTAVENADVLVVLVDVTKMNTTEEHRFLSLIVSTRPDLLRDGRMIFKMNKADMVDYDPVVIAEAQNRLRTFLASIDPALTQFTVHPVSTMDFALGSEGLAGRIPREHAGLFKKAVFGRGREQPLDSPAVVAILHNMVAQSNFLPVEQDMFDRLTRQAPMVFTQSVLGNVQRVASDVLLKLDAKKMGLDGDETACAIVMQKLQQCSARCKTLAEDVSSQITKMKNDLVVETKKILKNMVTELGALAPQNTEVQTFKTEAEGVYASGLMAKLSAEQVMRVMASKKAKCETLAYDFHVGAKTLVLEASTKHVLAVLDQSLAGEPMIDGFRTLLQQPSSWQPFSTNPKDVCNLAIDFDSLGMVKASSVDVQKQEAVVVPAVMKTVVDDDPQTTPGNKGGTAAVGAGSGAIVGMAGGPVGMVIGAAVGGICGLFFGRRTTTVITRVERQVEVEASKIVYKTVVVQETRYTVDPATVHDVVVKRVLAMVDCMEDIVLETVTINTALVTKDLASNLSGRVDTMIAVMQQAVAVRHQNATVRTAASVEVQAQRDEMRAILDLASLDAATALDTIVAAAPVAQPAQGAPPVAAHECPVCLIAPSTHAAVPCGHVFCEPCSVHLSNGTQCHVCRCPVTSVMRLFSV